MNLRRRLVRLATRYLEFQFLRDLYKYVMYVSSWWKYGDPLFPRMVSIEISTHCNRACTYCPNVVAPQKPRLIKEEVFNKIVDRLAEIDYNGVVDFIFFNEPTLHPKLAEYIKIVKTKVPKAMPRICTNGDLLTYEKVKSYVDAGLDRIYPMRHVNTPERRLPAQYDWQSNIDYLDREFPGVFVKMDIVEDLEKKNGLNDFGGVVQVKKVLKATHKCEVHVHVAQFTVDGDWDLCCTDFAKTHSFGSLLKHSIMDIWNDGAFVAMRRKLRAGEPVLPVCKTCFVFNEQPVAQHPV